MFEEISAGLLPLVDDILDEKLSGFVGASDQRTGRGVQETHLFNSHQMHAQILLHTCCFFLNISFLSIFKRH